MDKLFIDLFGLFSHFGRQFGLLIIFTCNPEFNVLFTEFRLEEIPEAGKAICTKKTMIFKNVNYNYGITLFFFNYSFLINPLLCTTNLEC